MSFFAKSFMFDGIPSSTYNLYITNLSGGENSLEGGSNVEVLKDTVFRRNRPYFLGATQSSSVLKIPVAIHSPDPIPATTSDAIFRWLFGHREYKKLYIIQNDMLGFYYNSFLINPQVLKVGNEIRGYSFTVECDANWAWEEENSLTKSYSEETVSDSFVFQNTSADSDYLYPEMSITINEFGGDITITNNDDDAIEMTFTSLSADEVLTINNDLGILTSSTGLLRMSNFNKNWFRFVSGKNEIDIDGNVSEVVFTYQFARKVV